MLIIDIALAKPLQGPGQLCSCKCWLPNSASSLVLKMLTMVVLTKRALEDSLHLTPTLGAVVVGQTHTVSPMSWPRTRIFCPGIRAACNLAFKHICQGMIH